MTRSLVRVARALALSGMWTVGVSGCGAGASGADSPSAGGSREKHELVDNPAPTFEGESVNGQGRIALEHWKGKVVLIDFWATWCEPCKKSFPKLEELRVKYAASGFELVAVSEDDEQKGIREFGQTYGAKFPLVWDKDKAIAGKFKPPNMPSSFLVDKKGVVRHVHLGYRDGAEKEIEEHLKSLL